MKQKIMLRAHNKRNIRKDDTKWRGKVGNLIIMKDISPSSRKERIKNEATREEKKQKLMFFKKKVETSEGSRNKKRKHRLVSLVFAPPERQGKKGEDIKKFNEIIIKGDMSWVESSWVCFTRRAREKNGRKKLFCSFGVVLCCKTLRAYKNGFFFFEKNKKNLYEEDESFCS